MTQEQLLASLKELVVERIGKATNPTHAQELAKLRSIVDEKVTLDSPLSALGWDSLAMTMLLVSVEERFHIDTSGITLFDLYSVGDFISEIKVLVDQKGS